MRFHVGLSFRPRLSKIKWLILGLLGLGALFLSNIMMVDAAAITPLPSSAYYYNNAYGNPITANYSYDNVAIWYSVSNPGFNSYDFTFEYNLSSSNVCSSGYADLYFRSNMDYQGSPVQQNMYIMAKSSDNATINVRIDSSGYGFANFHLIKVDLSKGFKVILNNSNQSIVDSVAISRDISYECYSSDADLITENANQNTQNIINNQNSNTTNIINNQNENTQDIINSNKVCNSFIVNKSSIFTNGNYLYTNGDVRPFSSYGITDYYPISSDSIITLTRVTSDTNVSLCFYDDSLNVISCVEERTISLNSTIPIPLGSSKVRFSIGDGSTFDNRPNFYISTCLNGSQAISDGQQQINDSLTNDNVSGATSNASSSFSNADVSEPIGLTSIITSPIRLLQKLLDGGTCDAYSFDISMNNQTKNVSLPSGCILWNNVPGTIIAIYHVTIFGLLGYRILIDMVHFVNSLRDPDKKNDYTLDL